MAASEEAAIDQFTKSGMEGPERRVSLEAEILRYAQNDMKENVKMTGNDVPPCHSERA